MRVVQWGIVFLFAILLGLWGCNGDDATTIGAIGADAGGGPLDGAADAPSDATITDSGSLDAHIEDVGVGDSDASDATVIDAGPADTGPTTFTIGGSVTGLVGTGLVLQNDGGDSLTLSAPGPFTFATRLTSGSPYSITVLTQPASPVQRCTVSNGIGTVGSAHVIDIAVTCVTSTFTVGGTITGLAGTVVLQQNGGNDLTLNSVGSFAFSAAVASGTHYLVTVKTQPTTPAQTCAVSSPAGTVVGSNVSSVSIACTTNKLTIGGTVSGLAAGNSLVLQDNGGETLTVSQNGGFAFATQLASGAAYSVSVMSSPSLPSETCTIANASGSVGATNVTNVTVTCAPNRFAIRGSLSGLAVGGAVVLQNNGGDNLTLAQNGNFSFATKIDSGASYAVTVLAQPSSPPQSCVVSAGSGAVGSGDVTSVSINCSVDTFTIGGTITGLAGPVTLLNEGGDALTVSAIGNFAFATPVPSGALYNVTVGTQPSSPSQTCTVSSAFGTVGSANVTSVSVSCVTNAFTIGGDLSGLAPGSQVVLQDNGADTLTLTQNGTFTFSAPVASGASYSVAVLTPPSSPTEKCAVTNGSSVVGGANVTSISIVCTVQSFTVGGTLSGIAGNRVVLQNSAGDNLTLTHDGSFTFATPIASGQSYAVTVLVQPAGPSQACSVTGNSGSGTVTSANVTSVVVSCASPALVAHYAFEEGSGAAILDSSGNGYTGTHNGAYIPGKKGLAIAFDGSTGAKVLADSTFAWGASNADYTVEYWLYIRALGGNWVSPFHKSDTTGGDCCVGWERSPEQALYPGTSRLYFGMGTDAAPNHVATMTPTLSVGAWNHIAVVHAGSQQLGYVNGALVVIDNLGSPTAGGPGILYIGNDTFGPGLDGYMDDMLIYSRALSGTEVQADMLY
jgi:hypothetical protein